MSMSRCAPLSLSFVLLLVFVFVCISFSSSPSSSSSSGVDAAALRKAHRLQHVLAANINMLGQAQAQAQAQEQQQEQAQAHGQHSDKETVQVQVEVGFTVNQLQALTNMQTLMGVSTVTATSPGLANAHVHYVALVRYAARNDMINDPGVMMIVRVGDAAAPPLIPAGTTPYANPWVEVHYHFRGDSFFTDAVNYYRVPEATNVRRPTATRVDGNKIKIQAEPMQDNVPETTDPAHIDMHAAPYFVKDVYMAARAILDASGVVRLGVGPDAATTAVNAIAGGADRVFTRLAHQNWQIGTVWAGVTNPIPQRPAPVVLVPSTVQVSSSCLVDGSSPIKVDEFKFQQVNIPIVAPKSASEEEKKAAAACLQAEVDERKQVQQMSAQQRAKYEAEKKLAQVEAVKAKLAQKKKK